MEKKLEEQARQMEVLQDHAERLQHENDRLRAQVEKKCDLGGRDVQDSGRALHPIPRNTEKEPIIPDKADAQQMTSCPQVVPHLLTFHQQRTQGLNLVKGPRIALPSVMSLVARPVEQGEKQVGGSTSQTKPLVMRWYYLQAQCHQCRHRAGILQVVSSPNSGTRQHAFLTSKATYS